METCTVGNYKTTLEATGRGFRVKFFTLNPLVEHAMEIYVILDEAHEAVTRYTTTGRIASARKYHGTIE